MPTARRLWARPRVATSRRPKLTKLPPKTPDERVVVAAGVLEIPADGVDDLVVPLVRAQDHVAQRGEVHVRLGIGHALRDQARLLEHRHNGLVLLAEPCLRDLRA